MKVYENFPQKVLFGEYTESYLEMQDFFFFFNLYNLPWPSGAGQ